MIPNIINTLTPEFALWLCAGLLVVIVLQLERLGKAIAGLHKLIFLTHEDKIKAHIVDRIADGRGKDG